MRETVERGWRIVREDLSSFPSYLGLLLHSDLLLSPDSSTVDVTDDICHEVMDLGESRPVLVNSLVDHLCSVWWREWVGEGRRERVCESLLRHKTLILDLCLFGSVGRRSMRYIFSNIMMSL